VTFWRSLIEEKIGTLHESGEDKRLDLAEAIRRYVRPGMRLNACSLQARPCAAVYELARQFAGARPGFEFISSSIGGTYLVLVHLGLVRKAVVSFAGEGYPTPGPSPVIQRALDRGELALENYTMLTISQRLLAGAMGTSFITTRSLRGSSIGEEAAQAGNFREVPDPFEPGRTVGLLRAYQPDLSFVHAWAADPAGNALCFPPLGENVYGALAAREGVILTAHRIVPTEFIRRHAHLARIPAAVVRAVCLAPYGSHPSGNYCRGIPELRPYGNDYAFMIDQRKATREEGDFEAWIQQWVLGVGSHEGYLTKLGSERLEELHRVAEPESWREDLERFADQLDEDRPPNPIETMVVQASRVAADMIRNDGFRTVLSGVGQATLLAWLAAHRLRQEGREVTLMAETGIYGHHPRPADPFVFNYRNLPTTTMLTDICETLGLHTGGATNACLGTIGAAQVDRFGNVNSTRTAQGGFIVGSGGANDIATAARATIVVAQQRPGAFVRDVDYVTSPGERVRAVVSTMGRFEKRGGRELILTGVFGFNGSGRDDAIAEIKARCGWDLRVSDDVAELPPPEREEVALLRLYDPERFFLGKAVSAPAVAAAR